jgi:hypothetical protein
MVRVVIVGASIAKNTSFEMKRCQRADCEKAIPNGVGIVKREKPA